MKTLEEWLNYLEILDPHKIQLGLERLFQVMKHLNCSFDCPIITVTGTNGKGSCVAFLEAIYLSAGYRTATYTSPHLFRFNERIRLQGKEIDDEQLVNAFEYIEKKRGQTALTYFEFITLAAIHIFSSQKLDIIILEVGLGGRLDAVNILDCDVAVVTTIGIDHQVWLGNSRGSIAAEKAGIFRMNKPVVCGDPDPPNTLLEKAKNLNAPLYIMDKEFSYKTNQQDWCCQIEDKILEKLPYPHLPLPSAAIACMVTQLLNKKLPIDLKQIQAGIKNAFLPGRFEKRNQDIFDVGHNPHAAYWLAQQLKNNPCAGRTLAVFSILEDKDILGTIEAIKDEIDVWYIGALPTQRAASTRVISDYLTQLNILNWHDAGTIQNAYLIAHQACKPADRVIIFGSFYTVATTHRR